MRLCHLLEIHSQVMLHLSWGCKLFKRYLDCITFLIYITLYLYLLSHIDFSIFLGVENRPTSFTILQCNIQQRKESTHDLISGFSVHNFINNSVCNDLNYSTSNSNLTNSIRISHMSVEEWIVYIYYCVVTFHLDIFRVDDQVFYSRGCCQFIEPDVVFIFGTSQQT